MKSIRFLPTRHFHRSSWPLLCLSVLLAPIAPGLGPVGPVNADGANTAENTAAETTKNAPAAEPKSSKSPNQPPPNATPREIEQGKKAAADLEPKIKLIDGSKNPKDKALLDKLNKIAGELGKASLRPGIKYTVKLIEDKDLNAFTLPNGYVYMYRGLVEFAGSDDELAAVLAHEIAHVRHRDVVVQTSVVVLAATLLELSRIGGWFQRVLLFFLGPLASAFVHLMLSPKREFAADATAAAICGSPHPLADALVRLDQAAELVSFQGSPATEPLYTLNPFMDEGLAALFVTHPPVGQRVRRLRELDPDWREKLRAA